MWSCENNISVYENPSKFKQHKFSYNQQYNQTKHVRNAIEIWND